ncbi:hypothetical protein BJY00DRAFT_308904 [Aspergillus carlsbadensis]|nr:hypothetical protein BJY00DRAFT_308904 [Aspergillus carlsbadensis]
MVLCHICEECAVRDPTSFGHLIRDPIANNGAPCDGCPLVFCWRHLYLNHDGCMCQRAKHFFMNDEPATTTHALVAHWLAWAPLRGWTEPGTVHFTDPGQDVTHPATTRRRQGRPGHQVRFNDNVEYFEPEDAVCDGVLFGSDVIEIFKLVAAVTVIFLLAIPTLIMQDELSKLVEFFIGKMREHEQ